jgi:hypothetical protein
VLVAGLHEQLGLRWLGDELAGGLQVTVAGEDRVGVDVGHRSASVRRAPRG